MAVDYPRREAAPCALGSGTGQTNTVISSNTITVTGSGACSGVATSGSILFTNGTSCP